MNGLFVTLFVKPSLYRTATWAIIFSHLNNSSSIEKLIMILYQRSFLWCKSIIFSSISSDLSIVFCGKTVQECVEGAATHYLHSSYGREISENSLFHVHTYHVQISLNLVSSKSSFQTLWQSNCRIIWPYKCKDPIYIADFYICIIFSK